MDERSCLSFQSVFYLVKCSDVCPASFVSFDELYRRAEFRSIL